MKILITNYYLEKHAGTELFTKDIALFLKEKGHDVYVFSSRLGNVAREVETAGIPVSDNLLDFSKIDFDIIHAQHNICALEARSVFPLTPMVYMCHGVMPELEKPASINLAINYYLVVSEETRDYLINNFGISKNIISIVRNFVDLAKFSLLRNPNSSVKKILYLSNRPTPGVEENIKKACENLRISYRHVGLPDNPVFDVAAAINDSDLVISLGRGALEALACGRNVIVYDYLGFDGLVSVKNYKEIRKCNFSGRRYAKKVTPSQLMEEIEKYSLVSAEKMRDFVKKNHNKTTNLRQIEVIYEKVVADKKTHNSLFSVPYREIRWLDRSLAAAELDNENMRTILTLTRGELSVLTGEKENLSLKYEEIISSRGWKALEYFRSVRYPKKFAYTTYKLFIKITKKILLKVCFQGN